MTRRRPADRRPILLFGRTGQIGSELERSLAPLWPVAAVGREQVDLSDSQALRRCVLEVEPALIINAAAYTNVDGAETEPDLATAINGTAPGILAEEAKRLAVPLLHYSTDYVFGGRKPGGTAGEPLPYRECDPPAPLNQYGRSKLFGEQAIRSVDPVHLILRTSWVFAAKGANFLVTIRRLAAERRELRIVDDQIGSPTWARAVASATARILAASWIRPHPQPSAAPGGEASNDRDLPSLSDASGTFHLSASGSTSWWGFASSIVATDVAAGRAKPLPIVPIPTSEYPLPAKRPAYSVLDNGAIRATFGIELPDWRAQVAECLA